MILFSKVMVAKSYWGRPPHVRAALSCRHRRFIQRGWSGTGTGSRRGCLIAITEDTQNLTGEGSKMQNYLCFERGMRPWETSCDVLRCCVLCQSSCSIASGCSRSPCRTLSRWGPATLTVTELEGSSSVLHENIRRSRHQVFVQFARTHTKRSWAELGRELAVALLLPVPCCGHS